MRYVFGDYALDPQIRELHHRGVPVPLAPKVYAVLAYLLQHRDRLVPKEELLEQLWPDTYVDDSAVKRCVVAARRAMGDQPAAPRYIKTLRSQGYRFSAPVTVDDHPAPSPAGTVAAPLPQPPTSSALASPETPPPAAPGAPAAVARGPDPALESAPALLVPAPESPFAGERKLVTVLCGVVAHAPALGERLGLDALHGVMQALYALAGAAAHQYGGTLQPLPGEGFVLVFGTPVAQEDHARRAILTALGLQQRWRAHPPLQGPSGEALAVQLALHTGQVAVGPLGAEAHATAIVVGHVMTLATALARRAAPGTILASAATLRLVHGEVRTTGVRSLHVAEHPTPVSVAEVLQALPPPLPVGPAGRARSPFVGRDTELAVLHRRLAWAERGQGQVVGVLGEPGIGKSRLLTEFRHSIAAHAVTYLQGRCHSYGSTMPYLPLRDLWRHAWEIREADSAAVLTAKVQAGLQALGLEPDAWTPWLLPLLDVEAAPGLGAGRSPDEQKMRTFEALHQLCLARRRPPPCVLEIENLHWIDATSEAYLAALVERLAGAPLLLLVSFRPGYRTPWLDKSYATQLALQPLEREESRRVLRAVRRDAPLSAALEQHLLAKAEGNPFFLEELAHTVVEHGDTPPAVGVPDTVQAVLAARIDRLPPTEKQLLQLAAVIGAEVPSALLHALAGVAEGALQRPLAHLQAVELLYETRLAPEHTYTFKHVLTHEVAYGSLLQEPRRALHRRIVVALETLDAHRLAEQSDRLAYHALQGEVWDKAVHYFWQAGTKAMAHSAHREAVACFEQALGALSHLSESPTTLEQAIDLRFDLRNALVPLREQARIFDSLREAETLVHVLDDRQRLGQVSVYMSEYFRMMGDLDRAVASGQRARALATRLGDVGLQVQANYFVGAVYYDLGDYLSAIDCLGWNVASLEGHLSRERFGMAALPSVLSRSYLSWSLAELGAFAEGTARGEEGVRIAEAAAHPFSLIWAYAGIGKLSLDKGDVHRGIPVLERGLGLCQRWHIATLFPTVALGLGRAYALSGRVTEAMPLLEQAATQARKGMGYGPRLLSEAYLLAGRLEEALERAQYTLDLCRAAKQRGHQAYALRLLGAVAAQREPPDVDQATAYYHQALALAEELGMRPLQAHCHRGLGTLYAATGQREQAHAALSAAIDLYRAMAMTFWLPQAEAGLARVERRGGQTVL